MTEQLRNHESREELDLDVNVEKNLREAQEKARATQETSSDQLENIRRNIEERAVSGKETSVGENEVKPATHDHASHKHLKKTSYKRSLQHIQSRLHGPDKTFSKLVHRPTLEQLSDIGARSVARPSSLLTAGIVTLLGSGYSLYIAKQIGFRYNLVLFVVLFAGGYVLGLLLELLGHFLKRRR